MVDQQFAAVSVEMHFGLRNNGTGTNPANSIEGFVGGNSVTYDVDTDSFRLRVNHTSITVDETFQPADIDDDASDASVTVYERPNGERLLVMLNAAEPILNLNYVTFGNWIDISGNNDDFATGFVVFGIRTPTSAVPASGTATYSGETAGTMINAAGGIYTVSGFGTLTANFAADTVNGDFHNMGALDVLTDAVVPWRDFTTTGSLTGNTFSGPAATKDGVMSGTHEGGLFGPAANEIGGVWRMTGGGENATGAFVGKK